MRTKHPQRGVGLIEAMIAMGVIMIGAAGLVGLQRQSNFFMGDSRRTTRASMFAQDLVNQIELWDYDDPRLANTLLGNDADVGDAAEAFGHTANPLLLLADHGEADLAANWAGLPRELLDANQMERYWNVADGEDYNANGTPDSKRIAVIVRWRAGRESGLRTGQAGTGWRRTVFMVTKINTADVM